ncbi:MAG: hypothetical protein GX783_03880 [Clostridiales bacterium]|nr:hypothetical protein [Clostridiales bacterium]
MRKHRLVEMLMDCIILCLIAGSLSGAFLHSILLPAIPTQIILITIGLFIILRLVLWNKWTTILTTSIAVFSLGIYVYVTKSWEWLETIISFFNLQFRYISGSTALPDAYILSTQRLWISLFTILFFILIIKLRKFLIPFLMGTALIFVLWFLGHEGIVKYIWFFAIGFLLVWGGNYHKRLSKSHSMPALGYWQLCVLPLSIAVIITAVAIVPRRSRDLKWDYLVDTVQEVEDRINDRFGFIPSGQSFRLSVTGFPSSSDELGGPVVLSDDIALEVTSTAPLYLRGSILNEYISTGWTDTIDDIRYEFNDNTVEDRRLSAYNFDEVTWKQLLDKDQLEAFFPEVEAEITHIGINSSVMFNSQQLIDLNPARRSSTPYFNVKGESYTTRNIRENEPYRISARVPNLSDPEFRDFIRSIPAELDLNLSHLTGSGYGDPIYREKLRSIQEHYMGIPSEFPQRIYDLVDELTKSSDIHLDKVLAIQDYLQNNYEYTLEPPYTPSDRDFVDHFLFDLQEGYCTYFATAMTVMTRAAGIPARYVEGFLMPSRPNSKRIYEVRNLHGHAWVEIYFPGVGWLPFDPTPPGSIGDSSGSGAYSGESVEEYWRNYWDELMEEQQQDQQFETPLLPELPVTDESRPRFTTAQILALILLGIFGVILAICGILFIRYRLHWRSVGKQSFNKQYYIYYQEALWLLKLYGFPIKQGETPYTYAERVDQWLINSEASMMEISSKLVESQFGHSILGSEDIAHIKAFYGNIQSNIVDIMGYSRFVYHKILHFIQDDT